MLESYVFFCNYILKENDFCFSFKQLFFSEWLLLCPMPQCFQAEDGLSHWASAFLDHSGCVRPQFLFTGCLYFHKPTEKQLLAFEKHYEFILIEWISPHYWIRLHNFIPPLVCQTMRAEQKTTGALEQMNISELFSSDGVSFSLIKRSFSDVKAN